MYRRVRLLFAVITVAFAADNSCVTPNGARGTCTPIRGCQVIIDKLRSEGKDSYDFIRGSLCRFEGPDPIVCCENSAATDNRATAPPRVRRIEPLEHPLLPDRTLCGHQLLRRSTPGLHKNATQTQEYPWLAGLYYTRDDGTGGEFKCSGSLISKTYVLTAAQCLSVPGYKLAGVRLGEWQFSSQKDCIRVGNKDECNDPVVDVPIAQKIPHIYYNSTSGNNDIALIRLGAKVHFTAYIRPICLPPNNLPPPQPGMLYMASGWGLTENGTRSDVKLKTPFSVVSSEECDKAQESTFAGPCIQNKEESSFCNGESGSPLMRLFDILDDDDLVQWYQEGVIYKGIGCRYPFGVYTRVSKHINWILSTLKL